MWRFDPQFDSARRARLEACPNFEQITERMVAEMTQVRFSIARGTGVGLKSCLRPEFTFMVDPQTHDDFFNGPVGYRAQYLQDAELGDAANRRLLNKLRERLLKLAGPYHGPHEMHENDLCSSLEGLSAKIWIDESNFPFTAPSRDLSVEIWIASARLRIPEARWGLCAPAGKALQIKGVFMDTWGNEIVPRDKIGRRYRIQACGFT
jgi:hypothetical protein